MKSLVTGASGYLGLETLARLRERGLEVRALVRPGTDTTRIEPLTRDIVYADLTRKVDASEVLDGIDCVYHLAAGTSGSHYEMMMNSVVATDNLLNATGPGTLRRFVLVSSFSVYQMSALKKNGILDEKCPIETNLRARDPYAITKVRQERLVVEACREKEIPLVVVRPGKIYGPGTSPLLPQLGLRVPGVCFFYIGGRSVLPLTHVSNCADAIALAGLAEGCDGEVLNVVDDDLPDQKRYLRACESTTGRIPRKVWVPYAVFGIVARALEVASRKTKGNVPPVITRYRAENLWKGLRYSNEKVKTILGWQPHVPTETGLQEMFDSWVATSAPSQKRIRV